MVETILNVVLDKTVLIDIFDETVLTDTQVVLVAVVDDAVNEIVNEKLTLSTK